MASLDKICDHCDKEIEGEVIIALGKRFHKEHFLCAHCKKPLKDAKYIEENGEAYCETDWKALFKFPHLPKCAKCNKPIEDKAVDALDKTWHKECFVCAKCQKPFPNSKFFTENGKPYCEADHKKLFQGQGNQTAGGQSICAHCNKPITDTVTKALGKTWHREHFMCAHCKKPFNGATFTVVDEKAYCEIDHKKLFAGKGREGSICAHCDKPITDTVLKALGKLWHRDHFVCTHCKKPIETESFRVNDGKPYCDKDYKTLFGKKCSGCGETIEGVVLTAQRKTWHKKCFSCKKCKRPIDAQQGFTEENGQAFCLACS